MVSPSCQSWFHHCHRGVAFVIALSQCCCCHCVIVVPSLSHCHGFVVPVAVSPLSSHCHGFIIAIVVLPSRRSQFCRCHCSVAFTSVTVLSLPSWCCLHISRGFVIAIAVSPSLSHHCGVIVAVASLWCLCCHIVTVLSSLLRCHLCHHIVAILLLPS